MKLGLQLNEFDCSGGPERFGRTFVDIARASEEASFGCIGAGEDDPDEEQIFRDLWEDETQREVVLGRLKATVRSRQEDLKRVFEG